MATDHHEVVVTRLLDAPRELVFQAWTDVEKLKQWWGPHHFTNPVCEIDLRPGGAILIHMRSPDGTVYPMTGMFQAIVAPERLVFTSIAQDPAGNPLFDVLNTVTFVEVGGKTQLTVQASASNVTKDAAPYLAGMEQGWQQSLERLASLVAG